MIATSGSSGLEQKSASKKIRIKPFLFLALFAFTFLTSTFISTQDAGAVTTAESKVEDPTWRVKSFLYYRALGNCFKNAPMADGDGLTAGGRIDNDKVKSGLWFGKGSTNYTDRASPIGVYFKKTANVGADGLINCGEESKQLITNALSFWGITAPQLLCNIGMQRVDMGKLSMPDCISSSNQMERPAGSGSMGWDEGAAAFRDYIGKIIYGTKAGVEPGLKDHEWYVYYKGVVANSCIPDITKRPSSTEKGSDNQLGYNKVDWVDVSKIDVKDVTAKDLVITGSYNGALKKDETVTIRPGSGPEYATVAFNCSEIVTNMNKYAEAYAKWALANKDSAVKTEVGLTDDIEGDGTANEGTSCRVEGIGWILCPAANAMAGITDALFDGVEAFMKVEPLKLSPDNNPLYTAWSVMRSIANVAFVIVFLIIIFSQLTSAGVSNYGVKKLLPRLIVGAILVNISFFICAIAVDVSNILGVGVQQVFDGISRATVNDPGSSEETWGSMTLALLSGSAAVVGVGAGIAAFTSVTISAALAALLPLLVGALFALVVAFLVLLARQALIIMLIVLAPLAFVAYLLPNTESLYKKWQKLFVTLLLLFPMLSVVFGASMLASVILRETSSGGDSFIGLCLYVGSFAIQAIPFFITPLLINLSQGVLGRFAGLVNNKNKGPFDRLRKGGERVAKDSYNRGLKRKLDASMAPGASRRARFMATGARRKGNVERTSASLEGIAKSAATDSIVSELQRTGANGEPSSLAMRMAGGDSEQAKVIAGKAIASAEAEELKEAMLPLQRALSTMQPDGKRGYLQKEIDESKGGPRTSAALHYAAQVGDTKFLRDQHAAGQKMIANGDVKGGEELIRQTQEAINANPGGILSKAPDLIKGAQGAFGSIKGRDLVQFKPDTASALIKHLEGLSINASAAENLKTSNPTAFAADKANQDAIDDYKKAINGFNSAIDDISKSSDLQGDFDGAVGTTLSSAVSEITIRHGNNNFANDVGNVAGIRPDGKIR